MIVKVLAGVSTVEKVTWPEVDGVFPWQLRWRGPFKVVLLSSMLRQEVPKVQQHIASIAEPSFNPKY